MIDLAYLKPTCFLDSNTEQIRTFTDKALSGVDRSDEIVMAQTIYLAVRDGFRYNPFKIDLRREALRASSVVGREEAYCVEKAVLLAAVGRAAGLPTRLGFANVRNHIGTAKLEAMLGTDVLVFHGYTEFFLAGKWVKATPAFNAELCDKLGVEPLAFNGREDSVFQEYNRNGERKFMEYLHDYGTFADLPYTLYIDSLRHHYAHLWEFKPDQVSNEIGHLILPVDEDLKSGSVAQ